MSLFFGRSAVMGIVFCVALASAANAQRPPFFGLPILPKDVDLPDSFGRWPDHLRGGRIEPKAFKLPSTDNIDSRMTTQTVVDSAIAVPEVLRRSHPSLRNGIGVIVTRNIPDGRGTIGLRRGEVVLTVDGQPARRGDDLPTRGPFDVELLDADGSIESRLFAGPPDPSRGFGRRSMPPRQRSSAFAVGGDRVSVRNVDGIVEIDATITIEGRPATVRLRGTPDEVDRQIEAMDPAVAEELRRRVRY